nr:SFT2 domain-containing protein [Cryptococcus tetragattii IND107]
MSGYIPLRNEGNSQEEEAYFALSVSGLGTSCGAFLDANALTQSSEVGKVSWISGLLCWWNSMFWYRILISAHSYVVAAPRDILVVKTCLLTFALAFTLGSCLFMLGFAILHGPWNRLTLFFAIGIRSTIGTLLASIIQVVALLSYVTAYFPGGMTTLRLGGQMAMRGAGNLLPI